MSSPLRCRFSVTAVGDLIYRRVFLAAGLRPEAVELPDGAAVHIWATAKRSPSRSALLLLHGFGASATWQWARYLRRLGSAGHDLYIPDLLFFGRSHSAAGERSDGYQAQCMMRVMEKMGVTRFGVAGVSYGGFVAYQLAAMFPAAVDRVVLICAGVCIEEQDLTAGLFAVSDAQAAATLLVPQRPEDLRQLLRLAFWHPPCVLPTFFVRDYIQVMCSQYVKEKAELITSLIDGRKLSNLPKITQPTLIIWGEHDRVFPLELAFRLNSHLKENSRLVLISGAGHAVNLEKPRDVCSHLKSFFAKSSFSL